MIRYTEPFKLWQYIGFRRCLLLLVSMVWLSSCNSGPEAIPEETMRDIMRDALISQSILHENQADKTLLPRDSIDLQTRILRRYDYTMEDFRFTIREMSMRKSNPLDNILSGVAGDMKSASNIAERRYKAHLRADSVAQALASDTVFCSDTILIGKLDGYEITYTGLIPEDSIVSPGSYRIIFDYSTGKHARSYTKSIRTKMTKTDGEIIEKTLWLPLAEDTVQYAENIEVTENLKQFKISLKETSRSDAKPDTCYLTGIRLVHLLPVKLARKAFVEQFLDLESIIESYEKRYFDSLQKLGGPFPPYPAGYVTPQRDSTARLTRDSSEHRAVR